MVPQPDSEGDRQIKALRKGFRIIEELKDRETAGVSELSSALNMPTSTVHVYLQTLADAGYVISRDREYRLSLRFLEIGGTVRDHLDVFAAARPEMIDLCQSTGETVGLGVFEAGKRVQLWQVEGENAVNDNIHIGEHTHLHWTSLGKALLADRGDDEVEWIVERHGLPRATPNTITTEAELFEELEWIRRCGYAVEDEERKVGIRSVSVPLQDADGTAVGALGINTPKNKLTASRCDEYVTELERKANVISIRYAY